MKKPTVFLRKPEVIRRTGLSDPTIWRKEKAGEFPKRVQLSGNSVGWSEDEISAWQQARLDDRAAA